MIQRQGSENRQDIDDVKEGDVFVGTGESIQLQNVSSDSYLSATGESLDYDVQLRTAMAFIENPDGGNGQRQIPPVKHRMLLDTGADKSYLTRKLARQLRLNSLGRVMMVINTFAGKKPKTIKADVV